MLNYDAILFDVDGTLIDSAPGIINTLKEVFDKMGVDTTHVNLRRYLDNFSRAAGIAVRIVYTYGGPCRYIMVNPGCRGVVVKLGPNGRVPPPKRT